MQKMYYMVILRLYVPNLDVLLLHDIIYKEHAMLVLLIYGLNLHVLFLILLLILNSFIIYYLLLKILHFFYHILFHLHYSHIFKMYGFYFSYHYSFNLFNLLFHRLNHFFMVREHLIFFIPLFLVSTILYFYVIYVFYVIII